MKFLLVLTSLVATVAMADSGKYEISKYRFSKKGGNSGERLVIEFSTKNKGQKPNVKMNFDAGSKHASIQVNNAVLVGAIPEAMINDTYLPKSHYLGSLSINTDDQNGFNLKLGLKGAVKNVDSFWIENPSRLVLDVSTGTGKASRTHYGRGLASEERKPRASNKVFCFRADSQVTAAITFDAKVAVQAQNNTNADGIVCYPAGGQVDVNVTFLNKSGQIWNSAPKTAEAPRETSSMLAPAMPYESQVMMAPAPLAPPAQNALLAPPPASSSLLPPPAPAGNEASASPMLLAPPPAN